MKKILFGFKIKVQVKKLLPTIYLLQDSGCLFTDSCGQLNSNYYITDNTL